MLTAGLWPSAGLLPAALPTLSSGLKLLRLPTGNVGSVTSWVRQNTSENSTQQVISLETICGQTVTSTDDAEPDPSTVAAAARVLPGSLRASKLCRLTGLCSRTNVNIVNTNMRCPTCLIDHLGGKDGVTFFPAVSIDQTVQLLHHRASLYWAPASDCRSGVLSPSSCECDTTWTPLLPPPHEFASATVSRGTLSRAHWFSPSEAPATHMQPCLPLSLNNLHGLRPTCAASRGLFTTTTTSLGAGSPDSSAATTAHGSAGSPPVTCAPASGGVTASSTADPTVGTAVPRQPSATALLLAWYGRTQGRAKGISRKFMFRALNKRVVRQMARRATIGFPIIGFFFVSRLLFKDYARVREEVMAGRNTIAGLFSVALACDAVDLVSQGLIIAGLAHANFGLGPGVMSELLAAADHGTVAMALLSFSAGVSGELLTVLREEREADEQVVADKAAQAESVTGEAAAVKGTEEK